MTETNYSDSRKESEQIACTYKLPIIKPTGKTTQLQTKGGVTITTEIIPFTATMSTEHERSYTYLYPGIPSGYDAVEIINTPHYEVDPSNIAFKIRIRNNESVPLKLSEVGFALIIDGVQWSIPSGYLDEWNKGLILTGFDKDYTIEGPDLSGLYTAQVVYLFLNGVPTSYDEAGNITKKDNFQWYFECSTEEVTKYEQKTYTYETSPIYRERCAKCSGTGTDPQAYKCSVCSGGGRVKNYDGKVISCPKCNGSGTVRYQCPNCSGHGQISRPKSQVPPGSGTVTWTGWPVMISTTPPGAQVKVYDASMKGYKNAGPSNCTVDWYSSNDATYPIIVEYQGKSAKVLPYSPSGKETAKISISFLGAAPTITKGTKVE